MKIAIVGSGNVASHLCEAFISAGHDITGIASRTVAHAEELASTHGIPFYKSIEEISDAELVVISVHDDAIQIVSAELNPALAVVHTSGNSAMNILKGTNKGVFYPLQTFTKNRKVYFREVPICIEASDDHLFQTLKSLGNSISANVMDVNSEQRQYLHLAAVLVNNFTNHLIGKAGEILRSQGLTPAMLIPLIHETVNKLEKTDPREAQTGPAKRGDKGTMQHHLELIGGNENLKNIYIALSESIMQQYKVPVSSFKK